MKIESEERYELNFNKFKSVKDLLDSGKYSEINYLVHEGIRSKFFETRKSDTGKIIFVIIQFESQQSLGVSEILKLSSLQGYKPPSLIDAFLLGEKLSKNQLENPLVFLHEPRFFWSGILFNLILMQNKDKEKKISLKSGGGYWDPSYRFVFRTS